MGRRLGAGVERGLARALGAVVAQSAARPAWVLALALLVSVLAAIGVRGHLGIVSDTDELFDPDLHFREARNEFHALFPQLEDRVLVVVDGPSDSQARDAARWLAERARSEPGRFQDVFTPGDGAFFARHGLLYLSLPDLEELADGLAEAQPFLGELSRDRSLRALFDLLARAIETSPKAAGVALGGVLSDVDRAVEAASRLRAAPASFDELVLGREPSENARRYVLIQPRRDFDDFTPARAGLSRLRELVDQLDASPDFRVRARMTGDLALQFEELEGVRSQAAMAGVASFVLVSLILALALRSLRLILATVATLLLGLLWTAGVAALSVGHLNVISVAFAVLFIGLGVDFGLHFCLRYRELLYGGEAHAGALRDAAETVGTGIVLCATTTAIGFLSFVPTGYRGVSELGVIAGLGMFVSVFATLTVLPACMSIGLRQAAPQVARVTAPLPLPGVASRRPVPVVLGALALALLGAAGATRWHFDPNPLHVRDPNTEGVRTFEELLAEGALHPWNAELLARDVAAAEALAERLRALPPVGRVVTLGSYVPEDQAEKLELLSDVELLLNLTPPERARPSPGDAEVLAALRRFRTALDALVRQTPDVQLATSAALLARNLDPLLEGPLAGPRASATLQALDESLVQPLVARLDELRVSLSAGPVTPEALPDDLRRRMVAADGRARVQVFPKGDLNETDELTAFYEAVHAVDPRATGTSVYMVESARLISQALRQAFTYAAVLVTLLLLLLWRSVGDTLRALLPLGLAALLTAAAAAGLGIPLNFADVIVLPLLLGIGVDTGIHLMHRHRTGGESDLLGTSTSRAVVWSALTTIASFGSLAFTTHRGMASLGQLLTLGVTFTLLANLFVLPALIALARGRRR